MALVGHLSLMGSRSAFGMGGERTVLEALMWLITVQCSLHVLGLSVTFMLPFSPLRQGLTV
jgi:hypothetical protein